MQIYEIVLGVILFLMASAVILCITAQGRSEKRACSWAARRCAASAQNREQ